MRGIADIIDAAADIVGNLAKWLLLAIVALEVGALLSRALFGVVWEGVGEAGLVLNAVVVLFGGGTLLWTGRPPIALAGYMSSGKRILGVAGGGLTILAGLALLAATLALASGTSEPPSFSDALLVGAVAIFSCWLGLSGASTLLREFIAEDLSAIDNEAES